MKTMLFKDANCVPFHEISLWKQTRKRWENEGMPKGVANSGFLEGNEYFGFEPKEYIKIDSNMPIPLLEEITISEDERTKVYTDTRGVTRKTLKTDSSEGTLPGMDQFISFPVRDRVQFMKWRNYYEADTDKRYPVNWDAQVAKWANRDYPVCLLGNGQFGFYSMLRSWMGTEELSYIFYDDPKLVQEMLDFLCDYFIALTTKALEEVNIDYFNFFEDMSYKNGPLLSPDMFKKFFLPCYKKVIAHLRKYGVELIIVDTDGNPMQLLPMLIDVGVNGLWPVEVAAGIDPIDIRNEFGNDLALMGGIDKRILAKGKDDIRNELHRILDFMLPKGGYIPTVDHSVPPDVSYENFLYYLEIKKNAIEGKPY